MKTRDEQLLAGLGLVLLAFAVSPDLRTAAARGLELAAKRAEEERRRAFRYGVDVDLRGLS